MIAELNDKGTRGCLLELIFARKIGPHQGLDHAAALLGYHVGLSGKSSSPRQFARLALRSTWQGKDRA